MNNKLEVGMFFRTNEGIINKIECYGEQCICSKESDYESINYAIDDVIKTSFNIIDLIEVGDYVNGHKVVEVDLDDIDDYGNDFRYIKTEHDYTLNHKIEENYIISIVTKEQFESMIYKVGEE